MKIPYTNHRKTPIVKTAYIPNDKSFVCFDLIVFIACGKNEMVVQVAATNPSIVTKFIILSYGCYLLMFVFLPQYRSVSCFCHIDAC